jgi:NAD(P)-dependent dehydrogenase (short-subunit alcohol dehydrogenase family)
MVQVEFRIGGRIVAFTRSLSQALAGRGIRVNGVAPGPVWTPLIPASFSAEKVASFGSDVPMSRRRARRDGCELRLPGER